MSLKPADIADGHFYEMIEQSSYDRRLANKEIAIYLNYVLHLSFFSRQFRRTLEDRILR